MANISPIPPLLLVPILALVLLPRTAVAQSPATGGFSTSIPNSREDSRNFFNSVYAASSPVAMAWVGNVTQCLEGTDAPPYLTAGLTRVNYFRTMAGLPSASFSPLFSAKAQKAALMMAANQQLNHYPPTTWTCYSADGAAAAGTSNLGMGAAGAASVDMYMDDSSVASLGHRRWVIYAPMRNMGQGSIGDPVKGQWTALYLDMANTTSPRPATRDAFVAWPPPGFVPYALTYANWSFSYPSANFSVASVQLTQGATTVPITISLPGNGYGDNTLIFSPNSALPKPSTDTAYNVKVSNVLVGGLPNTFQYSVTLFSPSVKDSTSLVPVISGANALSVGVPASFLFSQVPSANVDGYQLLTATLSPFTVVDGAESGTGNFVVDADTASYQVVTTDAKASGTKSFHLAHTKYQTQSLTFVSTLYLGANPSIAFSSRLGWATTAQSAQVQVSVDGGTTWQAVYQQAGSGSSGETSFTVRNVSLSSFTNKSVKIRFAYVPGSPYYYQSSSGVGWYIDNISLGGASTVSSSTVTSLGIVSSFTFTPPAAGTTLFQVQATAFGSYPLEWGPGFTIAAI